MNGTIGDLFGLPVDESRAVAPGQVLVVLHPAPRVLVGDRVEFARVVEYRERINAIKAAMRRDLEALLDAFAARVGVTR